MAEQSNNSNKENKSNNNKFKINMKNITKKIKNIFTKANDTISKFTNYLPDYLKDRFLPALILIPIAVFVIYSPKIIFSAFIIAVAILMAFEWITVVGEKDNNRWKILGLLYIILPTISLIYIKSYQNGSDVILWLFLVVWATDIGGLMVGLTVGGPKIAPSISPKKTWSGLMGGILASMFIGLITSVIFKESATFFIILSAFLAVIEQVGDFIESKFKRTFNVKDSGNIIPGHGGIMDRVDGLTLTAPLVALLITFSNNIF